MKLETYEIEHARTLRTLGAECAVLLKRNGDFPLREAGPIALFGSGARRTVKGGTGSGEVNSRYFVTVEQGLENAGFTISSKYWLDTYDALYKGARERFVAGLKEKARREHKVAAMEYMGAVMPEPEYTIPLYGEGDTAVYVLSRISGEGSDREAVAGDILLTETERRDILALQKKYKRFLLVLNVGGVVDLSPVMAVENILLLPAGRGDRQHPGRPAAGQERALGQAEHHLGRLGRVPGDRRVRRPGRDPLQRGRVRGLPLF